MIIEILRIIVILVLLTSFVTSSDLEVGYPVLVPYVIVGEPENMSSNTINFLWINATLQADYLGNINSRLKTIELNQTSYDDNDLWDNATAQADYLSSLNIQIGNQSNISTSLNNSDYANFSRLSLGIASRPMGDGSLNMSGNLTIGNNVVFVDSKNNRVGINTRTPITTSALQVSGGDIAIDNNKWVKLLNSSGFDSGNGFYMTTANSFFLRFRENAFIYHSALDKDIRYWGSDNQNNYNFKFITGINDWNAKNKNIDLRYRGVTTNNLLYLAANNKTVSIDGNLLVSGNISYSGGSLGSSLHLYGDSERELTIERFYTNHIDNSSFDLLTTGQYTGSNEYNISIKISVIDDINNNSQVGCVVSDVTSYCTYFQWTFNNGVTYSADIETTPSLYYLIDGAAFSFACHNELGCNFQVGDEFNFTILTHPISNLRVDTFNDMILSEAERINFTNDLYVGDSLIVGALNVGSDITNLQSQYFNKSKNEVVTGNIYFNPSNNITFSNGKVLFYSPVWFLNNITLVSGNQFNFSSVNNSLIFTDISGIVQINISVNNLNKGNINISGTLDSTKICVNGNCKTAIWIDYSGDNTSLWTNATAQQIAINNLQLANITMNTSIINLVTNNSNQAAYLSTLQVNDTNQAAYLGVLVTNNSNQDAYLSRLNLLNNSNNWNASRLTLGSGTYAGVGSGSLNMTGNLSIVNKTHSQFFVNSITGNVGIGTSAPAYNFDVVGTSRFSGTISSLNGIADTGQSGFGIPSYEDYKLTAFDQFTYFDSEFASDLTIGGDVICTNTGSIGWTVQKKTDTACTTTCNNACVFGFNIITPVNCTDATADVCICAGVN